MFTTEAARWPYSDAFPKEYRAFARLKEFGQEDLAVTCYGWIEIEESHYEFMDHEIYNNRWLPGRNRYAMVKELLDSDDPECDHEDIRRVFVSPKISKKVQKGLRTIHDLGIFVSDIKMENLTWGKHIDFSSSWIAPHPFFADPRGLMGAPGAWWDAHMLDEMVHSKRQTSDLESSWNIAFPAEKVWDRLIPGPEHIGKLRSSKGLSEEAIQEKCYDQWPGHPENFSYQVARRQFGRALDSARQTERLKATERPEPWICEPCERERREEEALKKERSLSESSCDNESSDDRFWLFY